MNEKNCTNCAWVTTYAASHPHWHCTPTDMDVNARMYCEEWKQKGEL